MNCPHCDKPLPEIEEAIRDGHEKSQAYLRRALAAEAIQPEAGELPGPLWLAQWFHDTYEMLAPQFGYETKAETRIFDATTPNGKLMIAVCDELQKALRSPQREIPDGKA